MEPRNLSDIEVLALTIYGEARNQPIEGQVAVGCVIRNRLYESHDKSYKDICLEKDQFSCWNDNDPNSILLKEIGDKLVNGQEPEDVSLKQAFWIANGIYDTDIKDNTRGALNYLTWDLFNSVKRPSWAKSARNIVIYKDHVFFNIENA